MQEGETLTPARLRLPGGRAPHEVGRIVGGLVLALALIQLALTAARVPAGRGLLVPAGLMLAFAAFGLPLPAAPYSRGDRPVDADLRRALPRLLG